MGFLQGCVRRKQVNSRPFRHHGHQLSKTLAVLQLIPIGVGSTIGAGVYVLVGTVAREQSGPSLTLSFLVAGIAAALSAFCYAELASRCPAAGSAYHYAYICVGEGIAWLIGWSLILEYTVGGSAVARGIAPNLSLLFGGEDNLPSVLGRKHIPGTDIIVDPCAGILVIAVTVLLCLGIKESAFVQATVTYVNVCIMIFVIIAGSIIGFQSAWPGYELSSGYFPYGINGMLGGAATVFFAYIGFDTVASTAEERNTYLERMIKGLLSLVLAFCIATGCFQVKNPQRDLPLGIAISLLICGGLYMLVSSVIVGIVPYYLMNKDTPISSAFADHGMAWAVYIVTAGALAALSSTLMGSLLPQPRILMAMARDGLLPQVFSKIHKRTSVPVNSTVATGLVATLLAFFMDVDQLAGMVSVGTLLAFTIVAISILILRYVPPEEVPVPPSLQETETFESMLYTPESLVEGKEDLAESLKVDGDLKEPLIVEENEKTEDQKRRKAAALSIAAVCIGVFLMTLSASLGVLPSWLRWPMGILGVLPFLYGLVVLSLIEQDEGRHTFGETGGFMCPFVPFFPILCILINVYLVINLGLGTWLRVSSWLLIGVTIYLFYGSKNSLLSEALCVSTLTATDYTEPLTQAPV